MAPVIQIVEVFLLRNKESLFLFSYLTNRKREQDNPKSYEKKMRIGWYLNTYVFIVKFCYGKSLLLDR
ncbi:hypothetical protein HMPREF9421_0566 [Streptococcus australis ATCC 700641]|uniref:Uncharacterized protein n=1 Tax=Streptococcus australis ATCC 700641 TaxID=888833 RepID=E7S930_9STRE|nr:hypothetical protein HMPREF9421_0566 [Streptococcus australis ATCC 700641]